MEATIQQLTNKMQYQEGLRNTCRDNSISAKVLNGLTIKKMSKIYTRILKNYQKHPEKAKVSWFQSQLRLYHWMLVIKSNFTGIPLKQFGYREWQNLNNIFTSKHPNILQFEANKFIKDKQISSHCPWTNQESSILYKILQTTQLMNRWNQVARTLYELSDKKYYRNGKQCREHWYNHLDQTKNRGKWNLNEDLVILRFVLENGHKWSILCKGQLKNRTDLMIMNRYNALIAKGKKTHENTKINQQDIIKRLIKMSVRSQKQRQTSNQGTIKKQSCQSKKGNTEDQQSIIEDRKQRDYEEVCQESVFEGEKDVSAVEEIADADKQEIEVEGHVTQKEKNQNSNIKQLVPTQQISQPYLNPYPYAYSHFANVNNHSNQYLLKQAIYETLLPYRHPFQPYFFPHSLYP